MDQLTKLQELLDDSQEEPVEVDSAQSLDGHSGYEKLDQVSLVFEAFAVPYRNIGRSERECLIYDEFFALVRKCRVADAIRYVQGVRPLSYGVSLSMHLSRLKAVPFIHQAWKREQVEITAIIEFKDVRSMEEKYGDAWRGEP